MSGKVPSGTLSMMMAEQKSVAEKIFEKLNEYRKSKSLETLSWND